MSLPDTISAIQSSKAIGSSLLVFTAVLSALFTELVLSCDFVMFKRMRDKMVGHLIVCAANFLILFLCVLGGLIVIFQFTPQEEGLRTLLKRIWNFYNTSFFIPFVAAIISSGMLFNVKKGSKAALCISGALLAVVAFLSGVQFFLNSFRLVQRPYIPVPVEAVSSLINSRMNTYPFALTSDVVERLGDGSYLLVSENTDGGTGGNAGGDESGSDDAPPQPEVITEPEDFAGYISALFSDTYAAGMSAEDYLKKAYDLFSAGRYTDDDIENIGFMWHFMSIHNVDLPEYSDQDYLNEALNYYEQAVERYGEDIYRYNNIAKVCYSLDDRPRTREYLNLSLGLDGSIGTGHLSYYKECVREWVDTETSNSRMSDAATILHYDPQDLSMVVLYGACALDQNSDVEGAYQFLCNADNYFHGGSAIVKILRIICADLMGRDESFLLEEIYDLEKEKGLSNAEEAYLVRYLFATNRSEELWGYIADVGNSEGETLNSERALMKAEWFFKTAHTESFAAEEAQNLLVRVEERLTEVYDGTEEQELLILARTLLQNSLGEVEPLPELDEYAPKGIPYTEYALAAITAFNAGQYEEAISYCENFFQMEGEQSGEAADMKAPQLRPQEHVNLYYYVQLVLAYSNFEHAREFQKNSEQWRVYMERAEQECAAFEQSSKSLFYIGELFQNLKNSIDIENGKIPEEDNAGVEVPLGSGSSA